MGFDALVRAGKAAKRPRLIGVQPEVCAPVVSAWQKKPFSGTLGSSLAEGTMVENPARSAEILGYLDHDRDQIVAVTESEIADAYRLLIQAVCTWNQPQQWFWLRVIRWRRPLENQFSF